MRIKIKNHIFGLRLFLVEDRIILVEAQCLVILRLYSAFHQVLLTTLNQFFTLLKRSYSKIKLIIFDVELIIILF